MYNNGTLLPPKAVFHVKDNVYVKVFNVDKTKAIVAITEGDYCITNSDIKKVNIKYDINKIGDCEYEIDFYFIFNRKRYYFRDKE